MQNSVLYFSACEIQLGLKRSFLGQFSETGESGGETEEASVFSLQRCFTQPTAAPCS